MDYLPIFFKASKKQCLVVGGGDIALRKVNLLINSGAIVECIAPEFCQALLERSEESASLSLTHRAFESMDVNNQALVVSATDDKDLNAIVSRLASAKNIPVNVVDSPDISSFIMPSIVDRSPLLIAISSGGRAPVLARIIRAKLETTIPSAYGKLAQIAGEYRQKVKNKFSNIKDRRAFWESVLSGVVAEKIMTGRVQSAKKDIEQQLENATPQQVGEVYLVGAGPGDPDLLTFKALRLMQQADVVLYDRLVSEPVMALVRRDAELVYVGKKAGGESSRQSDINEQLVQLANSGKRICRLKGGDPFIFGRGGEEIETLSENGIPFQVVPGITAASGCSTYSGIPLTHRDYSQSCRFVTAHLKGGKCDLPWDEFVADQQTIVFYMALSGAQNLSEQLIKHGMRESMPIALIEKGTTPEQNIYISTLVEMPQLIKTEKVGAPSLLIVGEVVKLHEKLNWMSA